MISSVRFPYTQVADVRLARPVDSDRVMPAHRLNEARVVDQALKPVDAEEDHSEQRRTDYGDLDAPAFVCIDQMKPSITAVTTAPVSRDANRESALNIM